MTDVALYARRLSLLLGKLKSKVKAPDPAERDPLTELVHAFLVWQASRQQAGRALAKILRVMVDFNDLRVTDPEEIMAIIGDNYHLAEERAHRLKASLHSIFLREHYMDLSRIKSMSKRDARAYLDGLEGMVPFVSASVLLLSLGGHAVPVDEQLLERLQGDAVVWPGTSVADAQAFLARRIPAREAVRAHFRLRAYVERPIRVDLGRVPRPAPETQPAKTTTRRKHK